MNLSPQPISRSIGVRLRSSRGTGKRAAVEDMRAEQGEVIMTNTMIVGTCCARPLVRNRNVFGHTTLGRAQHVPTVNIEGLMSGTERARFQDLTLCRSTFKRAAVEDMAAEQWELL